MVKLTLKQAREIAHLTTKAADLEEAKDEAFIGALQVGACMVTVPAALASQAIEAELASVHARLAALGVEFIPG